MIRRCGITSSAKPSFRIFLWRSNQSAIYERNPRIIIPQIARQRPANSWQHFIRHVTASKDYRREVHEMVVQREHDLLIIGVHSRFEITFLIELKNIAGHVRT